MSSTSPGKDFVSIGKITGVHGLGGNLKAFSHSGLTSSYDSGRKILVWSDDKSQGEVYTINWAKPHKQGILINFNGVGLQKAEKLVGSELYINKSDLPELEEDTYYWFDLIGLKVFTTDENYLGIVESIIPTGSNDVYVVRDKDDEILLPALAGVVKKIDLENRLMHVDLPEGL